MPAEDHWMSEHVFYLDDETDPTLALEEAHQQEGAGDEAPDPAGAAEPQAAGDEGGHEAPSGADNSRNLTLALKQERERRKAAEQQAAQFREREIRWEERVNAIREFQAQQKAEEEARQRASQRQTEDPEPNAVEDPDGWREWKIRDLERNQHAMQQSWEAQQQHAQQAEQQRVVRERWQRLESDVNRSEADFRSERPDYRQALDHVIAVRFQRWQAARPGITNDQVWALLNQERMQLLDQCVAGVRPDGVIDWARNPAAALYDVALAEGYVPPEQRQQQPQQAPVQQQRAPSPRLQTLQAGVAAAQRQAPGGMPTEGGGRMTKEQFVNLPLDQFMAFAAANPELAEEWMS